MGGGGYLGGRQGGGHFGGCKDGLPHVDAYLPVFHHLRLYQTCKAALLSLHRNPRFSTCF